MKIYYVANNQLPTIKAHGVQIIKTCEAFAQLGAEVELIIPDRPLYPEITEKDPLKYYGVHNPFAVTKLHSYHFGAQGSKILFWLQQYLFARKLRGYIPQNTTVYSRDPFVVRALIGAGRKVFWEAHTFPRNIAIGFYQNILKKIDGLVVISHGLAEAFKAAGFPADKILVAPDGIDLDAFAIQETQAEARKILDLPEDKKIIMYTGHLFDWKGADVLVRAAQGFPHTLQTIVVGGTKEDIARLKILDVQHKVRFEGFKIYTQIPMYLCAADIAVLPNKKDGGISEFYTSPLKLFEYMSAGKVIVASDLPSIREVLNDRNSVLVSPNDPATLQMSIMRVADDSALSSRISMQAKADAQQFSWFVRASNILRFLKA